jgi:hypothetical protein
MPLYKDLPIAGSIIIEVPRKLLKFTKKNDVVIVNTLTKTNNLTTTNKTKSIKLIPVSGTKTIIKDPGIIKPADKQSREDLADQINTAMKEIKKKLKKKSKST